MVFKVLAGAVIIAIVILFLSYFFLRITFRPSSTGVYHCTCDIPQYGVKEALVTVQIQGENWGSKELQPMDITLNILGYKVPCECRTA